MNTFPHENGYILYSFLVYRDLMSLKGHWYGQPLIHLGLKQWVSRGQIPEAQSSDITLCTALRAQLTLPCMRSRMVRVTFSPPSDWTLLGSILGVEVKQEYGHVTGNPLE